MSSRDLAAIMRVASRQEGVVSRRQALRAGVTDRRLAALRAAGALESDVPGVVRVPGAWSWRQPLWVARLVVGPSLRVSHGSAARIFELEGFERSAAAVTIPHGRRIRLPATEVHRSTDIDGERCILRDGLAVTNPTRTLVDLGGTVSEAQLEVAVDDALRRGLTSDDRLWEAIERLGRPGRSGVPQLRSLLVARGDRDGTPETGFETHLLRALRAGGLPAPTVQYEIREPDGTLVMRVDAAYVPEKIGIEADSKRWHATDARFEDDREKRASAAALGWTIIPVTYRQVTTRPEWVAGAVDGALGAVARRSVA